jgi:hypothetical protein
VRRPQRQPRRLLPHPCRLDRERPRDRVPHRAELARAALRRDELLRDVDGRLRDPVRRLADVSGQCYQLENGGNDDGAAISWRFQTRWIEPNAGFEASVWQIRIHGRGAGTITVRTDYASAGGDSQPFDLTGTALVKYDTGLLYDSGVDYAEPVYQNTEPFYNPVSVCRQFSLIFSGSSTTTFTAPQVLGAGTNPQLGYFALYGVEWLFTQLGLSKGAASAALPLRSR